MTHSSRESYRGEHEGCRPPFPGQDLSAWWPSLPVDHGAALRVRLAKTDHPQERDTGMTRMISPISLLSHLEGPGLVIVIGRPAAGKESLLLSVAAHAIKTGRAVRLLSLAKDKAEVRGQIDFDLDIDDSAGLDPEQVIERALEMPTGSVLLINYLELVNSVPGGQVSRKETIEYLISRLRDAAIERRLTIVAAKQLPRDLEGVATLDELSPLVQGVDGLVISQADPALMKAALLLQAWMVEAGEEFWPQEQTLQDWTGAALLQGGYCAHPTHIVAEVGLGEEEDKDKEFLPFRADVQGNKKRGAFLYDLVVLRGSPRMRARSMRSSVNPGVRLVIQIKSMNSARTMDRKDLLGDLRSLAVAKAYEQNCGRDIDTLFLVLATACKDAKNAEDAKSRLGWLSDRLAEFTSPAAGPDCPEGVMVCLVSAEGTPVFARTTGHWQPGIVPKTA